MPARDAFVCSSSLFISCYPVSFDTVRLPFLSVLITSDLATDKFIDLVIQLNSYNGIDSWN